MLFYCCGCPGLLLLMLPKLGEPGGGGKKIEQYGERESAAKG